MTLREELTKDNKRKYRVTILVLLIVLAMAFLFALCVGKYHLELEKTLKILWEGLILRAEQDGNVETKVVLGIRLPRVIGAILVGATLSVAGAVYQGIFRNPLVSPDFLGVSSGACIGAAIAILMALPSAFIQGFAFIGGIIAVSLTLAIPRLFKSDSNILLVLSGIIINGLMSSIMGFIKDTADPDTELAAITYWQMGSLSTVFMKTILPVVLPMVISIAVVFAISWSIDVVSLGEKEAKALGVNVRKVTYIGVACATLMTAGAVCVAGTISWVGLVVPHFARMLVGPDNRKLLPTSALIGAIFMLIVDTGCRNIGISELPISILTGVISAPFYAFLLYKQRMRLQ